MKGGYHAKHQGVPLMYWVLAAIRELMEWLLYAMLVGGLGLFLFWAVYIR